MGDLATLHSDVATRLRGVAAMVSLEDKDLKRALNLEARRSLLPYVKGSIAAAAPTPTAPRSRSPRPTVESRPPRRRSSVLHRNRA